ncbi:unnamed protein product [Rhizophagus irregularis]|nr:unnamed protein product [Rhizophagus irregularis]
MEYIYNGDPKSPKRSNIFTSKIIPNTDIVRKLNPLCRESTICNNDLSNWILKSRLSYHKNSESNILFSTLSTNSIH